MMQATVIRYPTITKIFHWAIAIVVILMLAGSFFLQEVPQQYKAIAFTLHKSLGITILFLMLIRFAGVQCTGRPALPHSVKSWERILSRMVQYGFYVLLIIMPLSGWIMSVAGGKIPRYFDLFTAPLPGITPNKSLSDFMFESHQTIAWILIVFICLHVAGALKHHFIDKDNVLKRMLPEK